VEASFGFEGVSEEQKRADKYLYSILHSDQHQSRLAYLFPELLTEAEGSRAPSQEGTSLIYFLGSEFDK
jgi:hypothetical protein